jgi:hypothetical protein
LFLIDIYFEIKKIDDLYMNNHISELFLDSRIIKKIQDKLPKLFLLAELESQRAGKVGMEVGSLRERVLVSLLIYKFGEKNVETELPFIDKKINIKVSNNQT